MQRLLAILRLFVLLASFGAAGSLAFGQTFPTDWSCYIEATADAPAGTVTNFPFVIQIDSSNTAWWAAVRSDGGDIRVTIDGTQVAVDLLNDRAEWNYAGEQAVIVCKGLSSQTTAPVIRVYAGCPSATTPGDTDTYGRENAYKAAIRAVWPSGGGVDRTQHDNDMTMTGSPTLGGVTGQLQGTFATNYDGSSQYGTANSVMPTSIAGGGRPWSTFTVARCEQDTANQIVLGIGSTATNSQVAMTEFAGASSDAVRWQCIGNVTRTASTSAYTINTWHRVASREQAFSARYIYRDTAGSSALAGSSLDFVSPVYFVGARVNASASAYFDGDIGWTMFSTEDWDTNWLGYLDAMFADPDQSDFYNGWTYTATSAGAKINPLMLNQLIQ